ncbi:MAG: hypothetical protein SGPRY_012846 [Prymnesium sp.]
MNPVDSNLGGEQTACAGPTCFLLPRPPSNGFFEGCVDLGKVPNPYQFKIPIVQIYRTHHKSRKPEGPGDLRRTHAKVPRVVSNNRHCHGAFAVLQAGTTSDSAIEVSKYEPAGLFSCPVQTSKSSLGHLTIEVTGTLLLFLDKRI